MMTATEISGQTAGDMARKSATEALAEMMPRTLRGVDDGCFGTRA